MWLTVLAAVSFIIKTKEEEGRVLKTATALQYESSDDADSENDIVEGKITCLIYFHCFSCRVFVYIQFIYCGTCAGIIKVLPAIRFSFFWSNSYLNVEQYR